MGVLSYNGIKLQLVFRWTTTIADLGFPTRSLVEHIVSLYFNFIQICLIRFGKLTSSLFHLSFSLNAVREVCSRCPLAMTGDLLGDLAQYKKYRNKAVVASARSLIQLYRSKNPDLLHKKDRVIVLFLQYLRLIKGHHYYLSAWNFSKIF